MSRRAIRNAIESRSATFGRSLSCVSPIQPQIVYPIRLEPGVTIALAFGHPVALPLRRSSRPIFLTAFESIQIERHDPKSSHVVASIARYAYRISFGSDRSDEVFSFHRDGPGEMTQGGVSYPHLHLGRLLHLQGPQAAPFDIHRLHVPTSAVSLTTVIRFLIEELGVEPIRSNWDEILANVLD